MNLFDKEIASARMLINYIVDLCADIPKEDFNKQVIPDTITPAWVLGHLTLEIAFTAKNVGLDFNLEPSWQESFSQGTKPQNVPSAFSKSLLIESFKENYIRFIMEVKNVSEEVLNQKNPTKILGDYYPLLKNDVTHMLTAHLGIHGGQLGMWRKAYGLKNKYGR